jgi:hypothetical protein
MAILVLGNAYCVSIAGIKTQGKPKSSRQMRLLHTVTHAIKRQTISKQRNPKMIKFGAAAAGLCLGAMMLPNASEARPVGTVQGLPFFGLPYPYGYVYNPPRMECYTFQQVETPDGPRIAAVWTCGAPVTAKY